MRQKDIEKLAGVAWGVLGELEDFRCSRETPGLAAARLVLRSTLAEVDPRGLYRPRPRPVAIPAEQAGTHT